MTMKELNHDIREVLERAKDCKDMDDEMVAKACGIALGTLRNKKSKKELPTLSYWAVGVIAKCAGYRIEFVPERSK